MRRPIVAGNWKMNNTISQGVALVEELKPLVAGATAEVIVCPPFTALHAVSQAVRGTEIALGAQNGFWEKSGAYTSQVSGPMLVDAGCRFVVLGHSEARGRFGVHEPWMTPEVLRVFGDTDTTVNLKARASLDFGLTPIVCCGELLSEREAGRTDAVVASQITHGLAGLDSRQAAEIVLAYEPVWAISTGKVCDPDEADRVCGVIRTTVEGLFGVDVANAVRIQYGGSVKPDNAADLLRRENIDGALVGGASLKAADFAAILAAAG